METIEILFEKNWYHDHEINMHTNINFEGRYDLADKIKAIDGVEHCFISLYKYKPDISFGKLFDPEIIKRAIVGVLIMEFPDTKHFIVNGLEEEEKKPPRKKIRWNFEKGFHWIDEVQDGGSPKPQSIYVPVDQSNYDVANFRNNKLHCMYLDDCLYLDNGMYNPKD